MATAKQKSLTEPPPRPVRRALLWSALVAVGLLVWFWKPIRSHVVAGTSYAARVACPCRFIAGRALSDCRRDFASGMGPVLLSEDADDKSVTAWFPLLSSQTATFHEGEGCVPERWED